MDEKQVVEKLKREGFSNATAVYLGKRLYREQYGCDAHKYSDEEREYAYSHGFTAEDVRVLGINDENINNYFGSFDYHYLDPIDPLTKRLVDGKLVIPYTIGGRFPQYLPKYYCFIKSENDMMVLNDNIVNDWQSIEDYLKKLLKMVGILAIKPFTGGGGVGFVKLEDRNGTYYSNGEIITDFTNFIKSISDNYLVTEFVKQCKELDEIWQDCSATLRIITISKNNIQSTFASYARFGTKVSKGACNLNAGGIGVPFNWETGEFCSGVFRYMEYANDGEIIIDKHPDSGVTLIGKKLPHFEETKKLVSDICSFLCVHTYFGFDIIISDEGPKICEINSHPSLVYVQLMQGGVWTKNSEVVEFFKDLLSKKKRR